MNSPRATASPTFKHLNYKTKQSPKEIKDKMRKNYKDKVHHCRGMLMDKFRQSGVEQDICEVLTDIYKSMFNENNNINDIEETNILEEIRNELIQEELDWWLKEYEKNGLHNIDWSAMERNNDVICPICQKCNLLLDFGKVSCSTCVFEISTDKTLSELQNCILNKLENHNATCNQEPQFNLITELNENHIYLYCEDCIEMSLIV